MLEPVLAEVTSAFSGMIDCLEILTVRIWSAKAGPTNIICSQTPLSLLHSYQLIDLTNLSIEHFLVPPVLLSFSQCHIFHLRSVCGTNHGSGSCLNSILKGRCTRWRIGPEYIILVIRIIIWLIFDASPNASGVYANVLWWLLNVNWVLSRRRYHRLRQDSWVLGR